MQLYQYNINKRWFLGYNEFDCGKKYQTTLKGTKFKYGGACKIKRSEKSMLVQVERGDGNPMLSTL